MPPVADSLTTMPRTQTIAPDQPLPSRKAIRQWLLALSKPDTGHALALLGLDYCLLGVALAGTVWLPWLPWLPWLAGKLLAGKLLAGAAAGFMSRVLISNRWRCCWPAVCGCRFCLGAR